MSLGRSHEVVPNDIKKTLGNLPGDGIVGASNKFVDRYGTEQNLRLAVQQEELIGEPPLIIKGNQDVRIDQGSVSREP